LGLFQKPFNLIPGVPGASWEEFLFVGKVLEIISRCCSTVSAIDCIYIYIYNFVYICIYIYLSIYG